MAQDPDHDRIAHKAHELWEAEGRPHGRDQDHWDQAREMVAIEDSQGDTLLPRDTSAGVPDASAVVLMSTRTAGTPASSISRFTKASSSPFVSHVPTT